LGPFGKIGTMLEGNPTVKRKANSVTRNIYVVDVAAGPQGNQVVLYVYKKTDAVTQSSDTITVALTNTVTLPLTGGTTAQCAMAANDGFLFIGTDQTPEAVRVQKSDLSVATIGGFSPPINVTSITSDQYGYVAVTFGTSGGETGNVEFGPNGEGVGDGGGAWFMAGTGLGLATSNIPDSPIRPIPQIGYHLKGSQTAQK
jgi:hypothetical protein